MKELQQQIAELVKCSNRLANATVMIPVDWSQSWASETSREAVEAVDAVRRALEPFNTQPKA